jgi:long-chain acyl-CoA synthetase
MAIFEYGEYSNVYEPTDNLVDFFESSAAKYTNNPLIGEKDSAGVYQWVTFGDIARRVDHLRAGLASIGVGAKDTVGIIANNRKEWLIGEIATQGWVRYVPMYEKDSSRCGKYM